MNEIDNTKLTIKIIAKKYNINYETLKQKYSYYKNNKIKNINDENRGGSKRKINEKQDAELYCYIKENYIDSEGILNNNIRAGGLILYDHNDHIIILSQ
jgi:transposase